MTASQDFWSLPTTSGALADALGRLVESPELRARIGRGGREAFAQTFSHLDTMAEGAERFYEAMAELPSLRIDARAV